MRLFESYLAGMEGVLSKRIQLTPELIQEQRRFSAELSKAHSIEAFSGFGGHATPERIEGPKVLFNYDKSFLAKYFGENPSSFDVVSIGPHPDFMDIKFEEQVLHHCVSVFVDIKGSTRLVEKYTLQEVRLIKDSLLTLAIQVANQFGGHVHRLQGDAIFMQFVRRGTIPNDAIINALNAASVLAQFVSVDLANIMDQNQIRPLRIRIGIDYGDDDKVLWSHYGIPGCKELTTTSLHTDMAAKLQAKAPDNSILIGDNIRRVLDLKSDFWDYFQTAEGREMVYRITPTLTYPFYVFDWKEYLLSLPFMGKSSNGRELELKEHPITIECFISNEDGSGSERYFPNSRSIPKEKKIVYRLMKGNIAYVKNIHEQIEWYAHNSGQEATDKKLNKHDFGKEYHNEAFCKTEAAYLGHHFVECRITKTYADNTRIVFPIFVH